MKRVLFPLFVIALVLAVAFAFRDPNPKAPQQLASLDEQLEFARVAFQQDLIAEGVAYVKPMVEDAPAQLTVDGKLAVYGRWGHCVEVKEQGSDVSAWFMHDGILYEEWTCKGVRPGQICTSEGSGPMYVEDMDLASFEDLVDRQRPQWQPEAAVVDDAGIVRIPSKNDLRTFAVLARKGWGIVGPYGWQYRAHLFDWVGNEPVDVSGQGYHWTDVKYVDLYHDDRLFPAILDNGWSPFVGLFFNEVWYGQPDLSVSLGSPFLVVRDELMYEDFRWANVDAYRVVRAPDGYGEILQKLTWTGK